MLTGDIAWQKLPQENFLSCFSPRCSHGCSALFHQLLKEACARAVSRECDSMNRPPGKFAGVKQIAALEKIQTVWEGHFVVFHRKIVIASI